MENRFVIFKTSISFDVRDMKINAILGKFTSLEAAKKFRDRIEKHISRFEMRKEMKADGMLQGRDELRD